MSARLLSALAASRLRKHSSHTTGVVLSDMATEAAPHNGHENMGLATLDGLRPNVSTLSDDGPHPRAFAMATASPAMSAETGSHASRSMAAMVTQRDIASPLPRPPTCGRVQRP